MEHFVRAEDDIDVSDDGDLTRFWWLYSYYKQQQKVGKHTPGVIICYR